MNLFSRFFGFLKKPSKEKPQPAKQESSVFKQLRQYSRDVPEDFFGGDTDEILEGLRDAIGVAAVTSRLADSLAEMILMIGIVAEQEKIDLETAIVKFINEERFQWKS